MIHDQKGVLERSLHLARTTLPEKKRGLIMEGGPGTGKSVETVNRKDAKAHDLVLPSMTSRCTMTLPSVEADG